MQWRVHQSKIKVRKGKKKCSLKSDLFIICVLAVSIKITNFMLLKYFLVVIFVSRHRHKDFYRKLFSACTLRIIELSNALNCRSKVGSITTLKFGIFIEHIIHHIFHSKIHYRFVFERYKVRFVYISLMNS